MLTRIEKIETKKERKKNVIKINKNNLPQWQVHQVESIDFKHSAKKSVTQKFVWKLKSKNRANIGCDLLKKDNLTCSKQSKVLVLSHTGEQYTLY